MTSQFKPLALPPGVVAHATKKMASSNYAEVNMVRWQNDQLTPIGGQSKYNFTFASRCKAITGWYDLDETYNVAYLCEANLYVARGGGDEIIDITPLNMGVPTPPTTGGYGDGAYSQDVLTPAAADWDVGGPIVINPAAVLGAIQVGMAVYNQTQENYVGVVLNFDGTNVTLDPEDPDDPRNAGSVGDVLNFDWYGGPRFIGSTAAIDRLPDAYSLSNFGAQLLAMTSTDGRLLYWDPADPPGTLAQPVTPMAGSTVPLGRCFVVTSERFVQIFGAYNDGTEGPDKGGSFRRFAWCEQEDFTNWSYSDLTTQAGFLDVEPASPIVCAIATRTGTLFFTGKKAYRSRYLGTPYIYGFDELGDNCTPWSSQSLVTTSSMVLWFSQQGPYSYDGTSILPVQCAVRAWIDDDIDLLKVRQESCAIHVANFNEFWWFFPQGPQSNPAGFNTRAVIYNYKDGWWGQARCARSAGVTASYTSHTIMANGTVAYEHESGFVYWDCDLPWIETFDLYLDAGFHLTTIKQLIPDIEGAVSNVLYSLFYRNSRSAGLPEFQTTPRIVRPSGYVDFRTTGRDIRLRIDLAAPPGFLIDPVNDIVADGTVHPVVVGQHLIDSVPRGDR